MLIRFAPRLDHDGRCTSPIASIGSVACCALVIACGSAPIRETPEDTDTDPTQGGSGGSAGTSQASGGNGSSLGGSEANGGNGAEASGGSGSDTSNGGSGGDIPPVITPTLTDGELETASGCAGVFNPDQLLTFALQMDPGDFNQVLSDTTYSVVVPAEMQCGDEPPLTIGVRRKRSGGQRKVGFKLDMNAFVPGQDWYGLKKLSLENGVSEGDTEDGAEVRAYVSEYLAWRLMVLSGTVSSRATFVALQVNGESLGVYVNVEQVDKRFLEKRLGDDSGWLYKKSGGVNDGLKTNELGAGDNPYEDYFCFWASGNGCPLPSSEALASDLPAHLDIPQFLRFGAVNAIIANTDGPLFKDNNYYFYDYATGPRAYIPWDLDTSMKDSSSVYSGGGGGGGSSGFDAVLFTHWQDDYTAIVDELLDNRFTAPVIHAELQRARDVAGDAFTSDPYVTGDIEDAIEALNQYWTVRLADVRSEVP